MIRLTLKKYLLNEHYVPFTVPFDKDHYIDAETDWAEEEECWITKGKELAKEYAEKPIFEWVKDENGNYDYSTIIWFMNGFEHYINHYFEKHRKEYELNIEINPFKEIEL